MANPSFQIDDDKLNDFDRIIALKRGHGDLPSGTNRSDVLRELVDEYIEGNGNTSETTPLLTAN